MSFSAFSDNKFDFHISHEYSARRHCSYRVFEWMDNTVYYEAVDITATHESQERLHIWAFCNDVTLCACVRVRACVCVFGSGVHLCVSVCLVRDFDL